MSERALVARCAVCGEAVAGVDGSRAVRCGPCFDAYLRSIDAAFLEHYAEFGVRARQVVAETCLRALVVANAGDRKLLGLQVYEQFVGTASDLIALVTALRARRSAPITRTFLDFRLDEATARRFFAEIATLSGVEWLAALGLPPPEAAPTGLPRRVDRDVRRSLHEALSDLRRLQGLRDLGERALVLAADHFRAGTVLAGRTQWLAGRELDAVQVASIAMDARRGRLDVAALRVDEERLAQVVDAIDVMTRLARNLTYAFVTLYDDPAFRDGFAREPAARRPA
jgi:hypothetical protein